MRKTLFFRLTVFCFLLSTSSVFPQDQEWIVYNSDNSGLPDEISFSIKNQSIASRIHASAYIKLQIYSVNGRLLSKLVDSYKQAGEYKVNRDGKRFGSAAYYIKLSSGNNSLVKKTVTMK